MKPKRKYPRRKECACCRKVKYLRQFRRVMIHGSLNGRWLYFWCDVCKSCEARQAAESKGE